MDNIKAFLQPPVMEETKEVVVSDRFKDTDGKIAPFVIRVIDQETNGKILKQSTKKTKIGGRVVQELDSDRYGKLLVASCVLSPNFRNAELCEYYKTVDPLEVPGRMLTVGEYNRLVVAIKDLNELDPGEEELDDLADDAKN